LDVLGREGVWTRLHADKRERDRLLLTLFAYGGLRPLRAAWPGLRRRWTSTGARSRVRNAKGRPARVVPIHTGLVPLFIAYAAVRPASTTPIL
jgi:integrase